MKKLFFKSLHESKSDFGIILACGVFTISIVYITTFISDSLIQITTGERGSATEVYKNLGVFILTYVILGILMELMTVWYIRKRSYEYAMFDVLGMKKKHRYRFIGCEYGGIVLGSILGGILLGQIISVAVLPVLGLLLRDNSLCVSYNRIPLRLTVIVGVVIFAFVFMICDELIACLGIDMVLSMGKRSGKKYRSSPFLLIIGAIFTIISFAILFSYWGKVSKAVPAALACVGIFALITAACGRWLGRVRQSADYYKKILWIEQWYHRFYYNVNLSIIIALFVFINLFAFGIKICDHVPPLAQEDYPYALVWMANDEDVEFIQKLDEDYRVETTMQPCVRVTTPDFGEHMGISASSYEALTGERIDLKDRQIYVVYQRNREERNLLGIDYGSGRPRLYIGNAKSDLWISSGAGLIAGNEFKREYQLVGEENRMLTGVYCSRAVAQWKGKVWEQVIVFSDAYFQEIRQSAEGANLAVMIRTPKSFSEENYEKLRNEIYTYARENSQINNLDYKNGNLIYEKSKELPENQQAQILRLAAAGINIFILMLCNIFILWIKGKCDYEDMKWKYRFYARSGMEKKKRKMCMRKELFLPVTVSLLGSVPVTLLFVAADVAEKGLDGRWNLQYLLQMLGISGVMVLVLIGMAAIFAVRIMKRIEKSE